MRWLIAIALLFSITPGLSEVAEAAVHLITHADLPHHDRDLDADCGEHSCTPLAHHCGCHAAMSAQPATRVTTSGAFCGVTGIDPSFVAAGDGRACEPPPLRPPIG